MSLTSLLRKFWQRPSKPAAKSPSRPRAVLRGDSLEDRVTPTTYYWFGQQGISDQWTDPANWRTVQAGVGYVAANRYPGQGNHVEDTAALGGTAKTACSLNLGQGGQLRINGLEVANFNDYLTLDRGTTLYVSSQAVTGAKVRGSFDLEDGTIEIIEGALVLEDTAGSWIGGSINNRALPPNLRPSNAPGNLLVTLDSRLGITRDASDLGANLQIGGTPDLTFSAVTIAGMNAGKNLTLFNNVSISVLRNGGLNLAQDSKVMGGSSATSGGILKDPNTSPQSQITNAGVILRSGADNKYLVVGPKVTNTGLFKWDKGTAIVFWFGFLNNGTIDIKEGKVQLLPGQKLTQNIGMIQLRGDGALAKCEFDGDVEVLGGLLNVGENQTADADASNYVEMDVTGNLTLGANAYVSLSISITDSGVNDRIVVGGAAEIDGAHLTITYTNNPEGSWADIGDRSWALTSAGDLPGYGWDQEPDNGTQRMWELPGMYWAMYEEWVGNTFEVYFQFG